MATAENPTMVRPALSRRWGLVAQATRLPCRYGVPAGGCVIGSRSCDRTENFWATGIGELVGTDAAPADPSAPGPFAFADKAHVTRILAAAGWEKIAFEPVDWDYVAGDGSDPVYDAVAYFQKIGPAASAIAATEGEARDALLAGLADLATRNFRNGRVAFKAAAWIVTARAE